MRVISVLNFAVSIFIIFLKLALIDVTIGILLCSLTLTQALLELTDVNLAALRMRINSFTMLFVLTRNERVFILIKNQFFERERKKNYFFIFSPITTVRVSICIIVGTTAVLNKMFFFKNKNIDYIPSFLAQFHLHIILH
jgi:hypothetical protein